MKVSSIQLKIQPYGASGGVRAINIDLSLEADALTPEQVLSDIKKTLNDDTLYEAFLTGGLHLSFSSTDGDPVQQREEISEFLSEGLSNASLDLQVKQLKREPHELRPPFLELHTKGSIFTGQDMFYENFNYVVGDIKEVVKPEQPFALVEISKHNFSTFIFHIKSREDWDVIVNEYLEPKYIIDQRARIFLVAASGTQEQMISRTRICQHLALMHGVRVGASLDILDA